MDANSTEVLKGNIEDFEIIYEEKDCLKKGSYRQYCFTSFDEKEPIFDENSTEVRYLCYSPEVTPTTKKHHWQGYVCLEKPKSFKKVKGILGIESGWFFIVRGTAIENRTYCGGDDYIKGKKIKKKNDEFKEFGTLPTPGKRTDLIDLKDNIMNGIVTVRDIVLSEPATYHMYGRTLDKIESIYNESNFRMLDEMPKCVWYYGKTGVGKTYKAFEGFNPNEVYVLNVNDGGFWEGYKGQKKLIINEFRGQIAFSELLDICDRYPKSVKIKGKGTVPLLVDDIVITSCKKPGDIYKNSLDEDESIEQFTRRCKVVELKRTESALQA